MTARDVAAQNDMKRAFQWGMPNKAGSRTPSERSFRAEDVNFTLSTDAAGRLTRDRNSGASGKGLMSSTKGSKKPQPQIPLSVVEEMATLSQTPQACPEVKTLQVERVRDVKNFKEKNEFEDSRTRGKGETEEQ